MERKPLTLRQFTTNLPACRHWRRDALVTRHPSTRRQLTAIVASASFRATSCDDWPTFHSGAAANTRWFGLPAGGRRTRAPVRMVSTSAGSRWPLSHLGAGAAARRREPWHVLALRAAASTCALEQSQLRARSEPLGDENAPLVWVHPRDAHLELLPDLVRARVAPQAGVQAVHLQA